MASGSYTGVCGRTYLGKVESHLLALKVALVQGSAGLGGGQSIAEVDAHAPEALEELEGGLRVIGAEKLLKPHL